MKNHPRKVSSIYLGLFPAKMYSFFAGLECSKLPLWMLWMHQKLVRLLFSVHKKNFNKSNTEFFEDVLAEMCSSSPGLWFSKLPFLVRWMQPKLVKLLFSVHNWFVKVKQTVITNSQANIGSKNMGELRGQQPWRKCISRTCVFLCIVPRHLFFTFFFNLFFYLFGVQPNHLFLPFNNFPIFLKLPTFEIHKVRMPLQISECILTLHEVIVYVPSMKDYFTRILTLKRYR